MNTPQLILRFGSGFHLKSGLARFEIPISEVRAIYQSSKTKNIIVETIDGKHMEVTSREIEVVIGPCIS